MDTNKDFGQNAVDWVKANWKKLLYWYVLFMIFGLGLSFFVMICGVIFSIIFANMVVGGPY